MKKHICCLILFFVVLALPFLFVLSCTKEPSINYLTLNVQGDEPSDWNSAMFMDMEGVRSHQVVLPDNSPQQLFQEIQNEQTQHLIASSTGLSQAELNTVVITFGSKEDLDIEFYLIPDNILVLESLYDAFKMYLKNRFDGHSKEYIVAVLNQKNSNEELEDAGLKDLLEIYPNLPPTWIKRMDEKMIAIKKGEGKLVNYILIDRNIVWRYQILYNPDGTVAPDGTSVGFAWDTRRCDVKEYEPEYKKVIEEVEKAVREEMEHEDVTGIGSCHTFWEWKKEYLNIKGIDWKSPSELNPNIMFD